MGAYQLKTSVLILTEYATRGDLSRLLKDSSMELSWSMRVKLAKGNLIDEYIPTAFLFYSLISDEDMIYVCDRLDTTLISAKDILVRMKCQIERKRTIYLKRLRKLLNEKKKLIGDININKFIM